MKPQALLAAAAAAILFPPAACAVDATLAPGGFTGLGITPNAHLLGWGQFGFTYDSQLPGAARPRGDNFVAGFGLLPNLEVSARLAANTLQTSCFTSRCGLRDLSASGKIGIGLDPANRFRIAAGVTDVGGAATNFRSLYGVLTYATEELELSGGVARRRAVRPGAVGSPLHGLFAGAAWQPLPWVRGHLEYSDRNAWAGVRLFAPREWLPEGWSAHVGAQARLTSSSVTERTWFSAGITIPLYKVPQPPAARAPLPALAGAQLPLPAYEARMPAPQPSPPAPSAAPAPAPAPAPVADAALQELARHLQAAGLEDIHVGRMPDGSVAVRANNATYNWNSADALGVALGATARTLGAGRTLYRLVLTQRQLPLVAVTGQTDCLRQWIEQPAAPCAGGELSTPGTLSLDALQDGATWVVQRLQPSWKTARVQLTPVLRTNVGTEVGALDYSAGINVGLLQPLWDGASAEWRVQTELAHSDDYGPEGLLAQRRILGGTERLLFTQAVQLPLARWIGGDEVAVRNRGLGATSAQASVGRVGGRFDGVHGALRWEPGEGSHRVTAQGGWFRNSRFGRVPGEPRRATPLLLSYRYNVAPTRTYLEATGGQFMNNDRGLQLGLRQWFGDVALQFYVRRTRASSAGTIDQAGLEFSVPLGPRRDMQPSRLQVTGTPRFAHAVETVVGQRANVVTSGRGLLPPVPSLDTVYNSDRASLLYFEDNLRRVRDAARW